MQSRRGAQVLWLCCYLVSDATKAAASRYAMQQTSRVRFDALHLAQALAKRLRLAFLSPGCARCPRWSSAHQLSPAIRSTDSRWLVFAGDVSCGRQVLDLLRAGSAKPQPLDSLGVVGRWSKGLTCHSLTRSRSPRDDSGSFGPIARLLACLSSLGAPSCQPQPS